MNQQKTEKTVIEVPGSQPQNDSSMIGNVLITALNQGGSPAALLFIAIAGFCVALYISKDKR
jgi:hypothetical protein